MHRQHTLELSQSPTTSAPNPNLKWSSQPNGYIPDSIVWEVDETDQALKAWAVDSRGMKAKKPSVWAPQDGSQAVFLECPIYETLYEGTRGPGKTDALIMDFCQHVGTGLKEDWKGILFRRTYPELTDVIEKSKKWIPKIWPGAVFNEAKTFWAFPDGEKLYFRAFHKPDDYYKYHGHAYPWIAWEELTTWPTDEGYKRMMSCCRSTNPRVPKKYRSTTNPYGIGHNWVKKRFRLPVRSGQTMGTLIDDACDENGIPEPKRIAIHGHLHENKLLAFADPLYENRIRASARNPSELAAWIDGSWDVLSGGMFDDLWKDKFHVLPNIPYSQIPKGWRLNRAYDHGSSRPFSVGWWAESNGEPIIVNQRRIGAVKGDLIRINEWYGWTGKDNEGVKMLSSAIGQGIKDRELEMGLWKRIKRGPADSSIYDDYEPGKSVAKDMELKGIQWDKADKSPGSRKQGWEQLRKLMAGSIPSPQIGRTEPGIFVCERCAQFLRTVPTLPRDDKNLDDVNTEAEDHIGDEVRYRSRWKPKITLMGSF